jgi:hypothetical protein
MLLLITLVILKKGDVTYCVRNISLQFKITGFVIWLEHVIVSNYNLQNGTINKPFFCFLLMYLSSAPVVYNGHLILRTCIVNEQMVAFLLVEICLEYVVDEGK